MISEEESPVDAVEVIGNDENADADLTAVDSHSSGHENSTPDDLDPGIIEDVVDAVAEPDLYGEFEGFTEEEVRKALEEAADMDDNRTEDHDD